MLALCGEALVIVLCALITGELYHTLVYGMRASQRLLAASGALAALFFVGPMLSRGSYSAQSFLNGERLPSRIASSWTIALLGFGAVAFLTKSTEVHSRGAVALFAGTALLALIGYSTLMRSVVLALLRSGWLAQQRILVIGSESDLQRFSASQPGALLTRRIVATVALPSSDGDRDRPDQEQAIEHALAHVVALARQQNIGDVILLGSAWPTERLDRCRDALSVLPVAIHRDIGPVLDPLVELRVEHVAGRATFSLTRRPLKPLQTLLKRAFDLVVASIGLVLLAPVFLLIAILIKRDSPGPVFFRQRRHGFNQREFRIFKFRSMRTLDDGAVVPQAQTDDPRITRMGKFLRRWNLDELPQLINVVKGDMSIVGPRPHAVAHDIIFVQRIGGYARRLNVRPGITGWAQVNGFRGETDTDDKMAQRVSHDLYYIDNWSLLLDLSIIFRTLLTPKAFRNAH